MNLFKKTKDVLEQAAVAVAEATKPPATAEQIQREMVDKQDALFADVTRLLESMEHTNADVRAKRLIALGFHRQKGVSDYQEKERSAAKAEASKALMEEAAMKYPGMKFIATEIMDEVCKKYGLLLGSVTRYEGEIPDWVIDQLERVRPMEAVVCQEIRGQVWWNSPEAERKYYEKHSRAQIDASLFYRTTEQWGRQNGEYVTNDAGVAALYGEDLVPAALCIAAPIKDMNTHGAQVDGARIVGRVDDPIVCVNVKGGYIVLAAWGEEGKDPRVFNAGSN